MGSTTALSPRRTSNIRGSSRRETNRCWWLASRPRTSWYWERTSSSPGKGHRRHLGRRELLTREVAHSTAWRTSYRRTHNRWVKRWRAASSFCMERTHPTVRKGKARCACFSWRREDRNCLDDLTAKDGHITSDPLNSLRRSWWPKRLNRSGRAWLNCA